MTPKQIAKKYVHGMHDALTDRQEIKDMITDIETYAKEYQEIKMNEIDKAYKEWSSICRMFNRKEDPAIYSHKELFDFAKAYHKHMMQGSKLPMHGVSVLSDLKDWCFDNCNASNSDRLHEILDRLDKR